MVGLGNFIKGNNDIIYEWTLTQYQGSTGSGNNQGGDNQGGDNQGGNNGDRQD